MKTILKYLFVLLFMLIFVCACNENNKPENNQPNEYHYRVVVSDFWGSSSTRCYSYVKEDNVYKLYDINGELQEEIVIPSDYLMTIRKIDD